MHLLKGLFGQVIPIESPDEGLEEVERSRVGYGLVESEVDKSLEEEGEFLIEEQ
jgi:hypothetical protein